MITIAGSGPSCGNYGKSVTIATKKRSLPSEWLFCRFGFQYQKGGKELMPLLLYFSRCHCNYAFCPVCNDRGIQIHKMDSAKWDDYWAKFVRKKKAYYGSQKKPSLGTCAVFAAVERWGVDEVGVIGYDNILDGNTDWIHDPIAEKRCIESLVNVVDLRSR